MKEEEHMNNLCEMTSKRKFHGIPSLEHTLLIKLLLSGFLSAADEILPGNYGMKDQWAALKWVQENIAVFGGDPKRVTIVGHSAGAGSVNLHMYSPLSTGNIANIIHASARYFAPHLCLPPSGLFHAAISQSGSALAGWAVLNSRTAKKRAHAVGVLSGCPELESKALVECLRKIPAQQLVSTHEKFFVSHLL